MIGESRWRGSQVGGEASGRGGELAGRVERVWRAALARSGDGFSAGTVSELLRVQFSAAGVQRGNRGARMHTRKSKRAACNGTTTLVFVRPEWWAARREVAAQQAPAHERRNCVD